jgi:hypothetical protein
VIFSGAATAPANARLAGPFGSHVTSNNIVFGASNFDSRFATLFVNVSSSLSTSVRPPLFNT